MNRVINVGMILVGTEARAEGLEVEPPYQGDEMSDEKKAQVRDVLGRAPVL